MGNFVDNEPLLSQLAGRADDAAIIRDAAVVDIGSNSVRLVIYRIEGGAMLAMLNERIDAGLGRGLSETGVLSPDGRRRALDGLARFRTLIKGRGVREVIAVATAAVREASDGDAFCVEAERALGVLPRVLSGEDEARIAALGVIAGEPRARGVVGDLGGSSLELASVGDGSAGAGVSLPAGHLSLSPAGAFDRREVRKRVDDMFDAAAVDQFKTNGALYLVGGSWRNLALAEMHRRVHPISVIQGFEMTPEQARSLARRASKEGASYLTQVPGVSSRRIETLPTAAVVLDRLISRLKPSRVVASATGLREGVVYEHMTDEERASDPLIAGCAALARRFGADAGLGRVLEAWIAPAAPALGEAFDPISDARLIAAACRIADISGWRHPDHRAQLSFSEMIAAPVAGVSHKERAFLARVVSCRYDGRDAYEAPEVSRLISPRAQGAAVRLGLGLRLGCSLSGRANQLLAAASLSLKPGAAVLSASRENRHMINEMVAKRLQRFADACGLESRIETL